MGTRVNKAIVIVDKSNCDVLFVYSNMQAAYDHMVKVFDYDMSYSSFVKDLKLADISFNGLSVRLKVLKTKYE